MQWGEMLPALPEMLKGLWLTVQLVFLSCAAGLVLAVPLGIARSSANPAVRFLPWCYIFVFRGTPLLVQLFLFYYGLAQFEAVRHSILWPFLREAYWCALLTFALHTAAYVAEILRGAIQAVPPGEVEAAHALGMTRFTTLWRIVLPRAARIAFPAYGNEIILMVKASALASTVTLLDLTGMAQTLKARNYLEMEMFLLAGALYLALNFGLQGMFKVVERHLNRHLGRPPLDRPADKPVAGLDPEF